MMTISVTYLSNGTSKEYFARIQEADLNVVLMSGVFYVVVEYNSEKTFIFGVLGKVEIHENNPIGVVKNLTLKGKYGNQSWVRVLPYTENTEIMIETPEHIFMMLNEIKTNASADIDKIRKKVDNYRRKNHVHNYARDYVIN